MNLIKKILVIMFTAIFFIIIGSTAQAATNLQRFMIHDQLHLLTTSQKQRIIRQNRHWQHEGNHPQIWVYTLKKRPADLEDLGEDLLIRVAQKATPKDGDYDWETEVDTRAQTWGENISLLVAYPGHGTQVKLIKSEDLDSATSDFQDWQLHRDLPKRLADRSVVYQYFNRFTPFVNKHVANVKLIKPGITWGNIWAIVLLPIVIYLIIRFIRWLHNTPTSGGSDDSSFDDGYVVGKWSR